MNPNTMAFKLILLVQLFLSIWPNAVFSGNIINILIVANSKDEPYQLVIKGFKDQLSSKQNVRFSEVYIEPDQDPSLTISKEIKAKKPDLIFSLGGEATNAATRGTSKIPVVATMILKRSAYQKAANITGVYLNYPLATQFEWLKKFFPEQRKIAIFFNPKENGTTIQDARKIAEQQGLELISIPVQSPKELPYALDQLKNNIEILLAIPDEIVMSSKTAKEVLLASFRNRVPLIGLSENWVKSGALYSLSWDYDDLGRQCAIQSDKLMSGAPIESVPAEYPRKTAYSINAKIAEHMNMEISQALKDHAKTVYY